MENSEYNATVEDFQESEYPMLQGKTYLDHAGTAIYAKSLVDSFARDLTSNLYGNPHLGSAPAKLLNRVVSETRERALRFFGADPEYFDLVFVANTKSAIKLITECFKNQSSSTSANAEEGEEKEERKVDGFWYGYHVDSHHSTIGARESVESDFHLFRSDKEVDHWLTGSLSLNPSHRLGLFAYPGQSNMTGRRLPQRWPVLLRRSNNASQRDTYSLLDAADLAATYPLNAIFQDPHEAPDFTAVSFYKIFGFPDLSGLIIRKASGNILQDQRYSGTASLVKASDANPLDHDVGGVRAESLEDGTLPIHSIIALDAAISAHERLYGDNPMLTIMRHTNFLIKHLYDSMSALQHANGIPICKVYKSHKSAYGESATQGATISFNLIRADGTYVTSSSAVEKLADENNIFVRSGQLYSSSDIATHLGYDRWRNERLPSSQGQRLGDSDLGGTEGYRGRPTGVVRVSIGAMTTLENIDTLVEFLGEEFIRPIVPTKNPRRNSVATSIMSRDEDTQLVPLVARERDTQMVPLMREREIQLLPRPREREREIKFVSSRPRERETRMVALRPRDREPPPPVPLLPLLPQKTFDRDTQIPRSPRNPDRSTQLVPIVVQDKQAQPHISKMVENFSTNLEEDILSGHLPVDFSTYQPYELVPRRYSISAPKKHVEFSLPYDIPETDDDESMIYPRMVPIPMKQNSYRPTEPTQQRKDSRGKRFRSFFVGKEKGPVATVAMPRKSVNNHDLFLM